MIDKIIIKILILSIYFSCTIFAQNSEPRNFKNTALELNTVIVMYNAKLSTEFEYYKNDYIDVCLQPGFEYIFSLGVDKTAYSYSPYYDVNILGTADVFYFSDISIKPFLGLAFRINSDSPTRKTSIEPKFGSTIQFNICRQFNLIIKYMYVSKQDNQDIPVLFGLGFTVLFN